MKGQEKILQESREALAAAQAASLPTLAKTISERVKRQEEAVRISKATVEELERAIGVGASAQIDVEDIAPPPASENIAPPPASGRRR